MTRAFTALGVVLALAAFPLAARADDYGPKQDIAAIRHDVPILLAAQLRREHAEAAKLTIAGVVVSNALALAEWHAGDSGGILALTDRLGKWWIDASSNLPLLPGAISASCDMYLPATHWPLIKLADKHLPAITEKLHPPPPPGGREYVDCFGSAPTPPTYVIDASPYKAILTLAARDAIGDEKIADFSGRAPTEAESWANPPSGNSYFFFSGIVQSPQPVHVQAGTTIDVWFPFVLDPSQHYSLTIAAPKTLSLGPIEGSLKDNTLHFVLPAFTATPGADLMGEIASD